MTPRWSLFGLLLLAALLGGLFALGAEHGVVALMPSPAPTPTATSQPTPTARTIVIPPPTPLPTLTAATPLAAESQNQQLVQLKQQLALQQALVFVLRAQQHVALAAGSLNENDLTKTNQELVAAHAALDRAFEQVPEELKQGIDSERREIGRVRADLYISPEGLDDRLRAMQDRLLVLTVP